MEKGGKGVDVPSVRFRVKSGQLTQKERLLSGQAGGEGGVGSMRLAITKGQTKKGGGGEENRPCTKEGEVNGSPRGITTGGGRNWDEEYKEVALSPGEMCRRPHILSLSLLQHFSLCPNSPLLLARFPLRYGRRKKGGRVDDF